MAAFSGYGFCCCGEQPCVTTRQCCGTTTPTIWKLSASAGAPDTSDDDCQDDCCESLSDPNWLLAIADRVRARNFEEDGWVSRTMIVPEEYDGEEADIRCYWGTVDLENPTDDPAGFWPVRQVACPFNDDPCDTFDPFWRLDIIGNLPQHVAPVWTVLSECRTGESGDETRLVAVTQMLRVFANICGGIVPGYGWVAHARYATDWMSTAAMQALIDAADVTPIELDLVTMTNATYDPQCPSASADPVTGRVTIPSPYGCNFGETVELLRLSDGCGRITVGCDTLCEPKIDDDDLIFTGTLPDEGEIRVCMGKIYNVELCSVEWTGSTANSYGDCDDIVITGTIRCDELVEGEGRVWHLILETPEGTFTYPLESITTDENDLLISADVSGTIDLCTGETGLAMVGTIEPCNEPVFEDCCPLWGCCQQTLQVEGSLSKLDPEGECPIPDSGLDCQGSVETLTRQTGDITCGGVSIAGDLTGFDPNKDYFRGPAPFNSDAVGGGSIGDLLVWCDNGTVRWAWLSPESCGGTGYGVGVQGTIAMDGSCATGTVTGQWLDPESGCCEGGIDRQMSFAQ